ncbi:CD47 isoform 4, partial [Pongo abelii]
WTESLYCGVYTNAWPSSDFRFEYLSSSTITWTSLYEICGVQRDTYGQLKGKKRQASNQKTIQPPRKAVEEPLNAFKESKGMMNDE